MRNSRRPMMAIDYEYALSWLNNARIHVMPSQYFPRESQDKDAYELLYALSMELIRDILSGSDAGSVLLSFGVDKERLS